LIKIIILGEEREASEKARDGSNAEVKATWQMQKLASERILFFYLKT